MENCTIQISLVTIVTIHPGINKKKVFQYVLFIRFRSNAAATVESPLSSKYSLDQEHHHHNAQDAQKTPATASGEFITFFFCCCVNKNNLCIHT